MKFPKPKRTKDRKLLDKFHEMPCLVCGYPESEPCHVKSRGAGGPDEAFNLIPFCQRDHRAQHDKGWKSFLESNPVVKDYLEVLGWDTNDMTHPRLKP